VGNQHPERSQCATWRITAKNHQRTTLTSSADEADGRTVGLKHLEIPCRGNPTQIARLFKDIMLTKLVQVSSSSAQRIHLNHLIDRWEKQVRGFSVSASSIQSILPP